MKTDKYRCDKDFHRYLDGEMPPDEKKRFEASLSASSELSGLLHFFKALRETARQDIESEMQHPPTAYLREVVAGRLVLVSERASLWRGVPLWRLGPGLGAVCTALVVTYALFFRPMFLPPDNECMIEYINNRTSFVTIFRGSTDGLTYIWITENPDRLADEKHSRKAKEQLYS